MTIVACLMSQMPLLACRERPHGRRTFQYHGCIPIVVWRQHNPALRANFRREETHGTGKPAHVCQLREKLLGCGFELSCIVSVGRSYTADANILLKSRT